MMPSNKCLVVLLMLSLNSCGAPLSSRLASIHRPENPIKPLIIGMSGFATCEESEQHEGLYGPLGSRMMSHVLDLKTYVDQKTGQDTKVMASCFTTDRELITSSSADRWTIKTPSDEEYIETLHQKMAEFTDVYVVGHSYGGWLAMKVIETWQGSSSLVKYLYTIDPISKRLCFFDNPADCVSAPKDISAAGRQHIKENTQLWVNPWQYKTIFLHSSVIPQADENPRFDISHWEIDNQAEIWNGLKSKLTF